MAENHQVAIPLIKDTLPIDNPHLLNAVVSTLENVVKQTVEDLKDIDELEGADIFKAMVREGCTDFLGDMMQHFFQSKSFLQLSMIQQKLFQQLEITVRQELFAKGVNRVTLSQLEAEKYNLLSRLIQAGNDKHVLELVRYYSELMHEFLEIPIDDEEFQEEMKQSLIRFAASVSEKHFNSAALKVVRDTEQYYFEEVSMMAQTREVISYDPLFSLPKGKYFSIEPYTII